ncbi:MAG TPA: Stk1 family PASTA domain-containing Ser/Thr kinase [Clostridiaceae bacterium]|nr:Stk1 family PASTA domain-containing Ser/Thr kinase [Clostridiaceae bacterium]
MKVNKQYLASGTVLGGRYSIIRTLGQGGMAHVYMAEDLQSKSYVALKVMRDELSDDPEFIRRFATEARAAASLDHPNIVAVLDYGQDNEIRYIVQEYVEGKTLKDLIREQGALDYHLAVPLMVQIGLALEHAHKRGVIHRDMKPQNVMITSDMVAKVTDFGIARTTNANTITLTGGVAFGSVHYFSPEQARGSHVTERSDLYSLGIMLYEMLTGELPFDGDSSVAVAIKQLQEMPDPPSRYNPKLPRSLDNIIFKAIQKSPGNRYPSARAFVNELDAFLKNPQGRYGVVIGNRNRVEASSALGGQGKGSNFEKIHELESSLHQSRRTRTRGTSVVVAIIVITVAVVIAGLYWLINSIKKSNSQNAKDFFVLEDYTGENIEIVANNLINEYGLEIEKDLFIEWKTNDVTKGNIYAQDPKPKQKFFIGKDKLMLKVSAGSEILYVPDVIGETKEKASSLLESMGYNVLIKYESSETYSENTVTNSLPRPGSALPPGEKVTIYVSEGPTDATAATTEVPYIIGYTWEAAMQILSDANLNIGEATGIDGSVAEKDRIIIKQSPAEGVIVRTNSEVAVTYGTSKQYDEYMNPTEATTSKGVTSMPNFVGKTWNVAYNEITNWNADSIPDNIKVTYISEASKSEAYHQTNPEKAYILRQSVSPGTNLTGVNEVLFTLGTYTDYQQMLNPTEPPTTTTEPPTTTPSTTTPTTTPVSEPEPEPEPQPGSTEGDS